MKDAPVVEKKHRKSVAFSEGTTIMDANGAISEASHSDEKTTAERHTASKSWCPQCPFFSRSLSSILLIFQRAQSASPDKEVDEVTELFKGLSKKKKTKKTKDADAEPNADGEFDPSMMKKKKKSSKKTADGDFEAKLAEAGLAGEEATPEEKPSTEEIVSDIENGRGIWTHDAAQPIPYNLLVTRFFTLIHSHHPDILLSGSKSYKIPPPQCLREGNRRTIFANITDICKRMKRSEDHVMQFLFAELVTNGSVDGSRRLVIKGRFQQKQIENVLRRYIGQSMPLLSI